MKKAVLYLDDNPIEDFIAVLEDFEGCQVTVVQTISDCVKQLYEKQFKAIIMDIIVPAGDEYREFFKFTSGTRHCPGFELMKMIREGYFGKILTIISSGIIEERYLRLRIERLLNEHIHAVPKPEIEEIFRLLSTI
jgi:CheY-like chemotaxis protein